MTHLFDPSVLRAYDVRGVVGETLGEADAYALGRGFGTVVVRAGGSRVAVGYDGRLSSPMLEGALVQGLTQSGVDVVRIGLGPTPMLYYAEAELGVDGAIQVTGSHNPADHNGFKMVLEHRPFFGEAIVGLARQAAAGDWEEGAGGVKAVAVMDRYAARLVEGFDGAAYRIGWDAGNGAAGPVVEKLVKLIPGEHHLLFTDIDGHFPHHHPDPAEEANLADLKALVLDKKLDFGVAFDGDGDRIGAVDGLGRTIWADQLLAILAEPVLRNQPGAPIIADVKAGQMVFDRIAVLGGEPIMGESGHSLMKSRMAQSASPLAAEMSGHLYFGPPDYYGFDDALYAAVRLIRAATRVGRTVTQLRSAMPVPIDTPELRFAVDGKRKFAIVDEVLERLKMTDARVNTIDGVRVDTGDGWWLLRASNTQDMLVVRAEAKDEDGLARLLRTVDSQLAESGIVRPGTAGF
ncbi:phosphoglucomutase/phosphomannomutase PgmG [Sphingobium aromaticiconvertens]|uniref:phosphoglucomutase/phosphomannomutase PgmG n=1 Tax=Sphingobium aromaticiconvertens TaxID=365341 RepID=UPI0030188C5A